MPELSRMACAAPRPERRHAASIGAMTPALPELSLPLPAAAAALAAALGCGLLIGVERERRKGSGPGRAMAGVRSFALVSLMGAVCALIGQAMTVMGAVGIV